MNKDEMRMMLWKLESTFRVQQCEPKICRVVCVDACEAFELVSKLIQELDGVEPKKEVTR